MKNLVRKSNFTSVQSVLSFITIALIYNKKFYSTDDRKLSKSTWPEILGKRGPLVSAHKLAKMYINIGKAITVKEVNDVLAFSGISITQAMLDLLLSRPRLEFSNLDSNTVRSDRFMQSIGTVRGKAVPGVYIWTHLPTGDMYVGSSSSLARRLIGYFNSTHGVTGKLIPLIKREGIGAFKLEVIPLTESYAENQELSLEQYFLLHSKFNLNTLRVVNDISGVRAKNLYMYTKDLSELIYWSDTQEDFIFKLGIHHSTFSNSLKTGSTYLNKYIFTDKPVVGARVSEMTEDEIYSMLDRDRLEERNTKKVTRKVLIKAVDDTNNSKLFDTINDCISYLNSIAPSNKTTLYRRIESLKPYHGFICQWESEETMHIRDKAVQISVTDMSTGKTEIYSSMREAALSFAPEYNTTGPTVKAYAESGKLFKEKYKITCL